MFIALVGTRHAGKSALEQYLVAHKAFTPLRIVRSAPDDYQHPSPESSPDTSIEIPMSSGYGSNLKPNANLRVSFLAMSNSALPTPLASPAQGIPDFRQSQQQPLYFASTSELLDHITRNWRTNFVTDSLTTRDDIAAFIKRPFFMVVSVDAPLMTRFRRSGRSSLEEFVQENDAIVYGSPASLTSKDTAGSVPLVNMNAFINVQITNSFNSLADFYAHLDKINLLDASRLRPHWDTYFMTLTSLASQRSNCMKRRVGAILVRENRILATGYNGTARGLSNCNEGGCASCNGTNEKMQCICLHAEENAILEAGRERVGINAVLYSNTCPCLKCAIIIIQAGVKEVVYELSYKVDEESAKRFAEAGVKLRKYAPPPATVPDALFPDGIPRTVRFSDTKVIYRQ